MGFLTWTVLNAIIITNSVNNDLTDEWSYGGSYTSSVSTESSTNAYYYLRSSRRYTVLRSKGTYQLHVIVMHDYRRLFFGFL